MKKYYGSSSCVPISFASVFLFSAIFALCYFSFLDPHKIDYINGLNKLVNSTSHSTKVVDEDQGDGEESTLPSIDDPLLPPQDVSKEERIAWFKQKVPRLRIIHSTPRTRKFNKRVQEFLGGQGTNQSRCTTRFFMTWIAPATLFGKRNFISLESIFKSHPKGCVVILSPSLDSKFGAGILEPLLSRGYQVFPVTPDLPFLSNNTLAQAWLEGLKNGTIDPGKIPITQNLSNLLRLMAIYKYGGIYLDMDFIILKDISGLRNSIGIQTVNDATKEWKTLNNAVLIFDKEHPLILKFIEEFSTHFDGNVWGQNGPYMVTRVVREVINNSRFKFNILPQMAFYPVDWVHIGDLFQQPKDKSWKKWVDDKLVLFEKECFGIHLWNKFSRKSKIEQGSIMWRLISDHCIICRDVYDNE